MTPRRIRLLLADADGGRALVGISLPDLAPAPPEPGTPLLVLSAAGMRAGAADPEIARAPSVFHLGRLPEAEAALEALRPPAAPHAVAAAIAAALDAKAPGEALARRIAEAGLRDLAELQLRHLLHRMATASGGWRLRRIQQVLLRDLPPSWRPDAPERPWEGHQDDVRDTARALAGAPRGEPLAPLQALAADAAAALAMLVPDPRRRLSGRSAPRIRGALQEALAAVAALLPPGRGALAPEGAARVAAVALLALEALLADGDALLLLCDADLRPLGGQGLWMQRLRVAQGRLRTAGPLVRPDVTTLSMALGRGRAILFSEDRRLEVARLLYQAELGGLAPEHCVLLDRLAADLGRPAADLAAFGAMPERLPPDVSPAQAASAAVRRGLNHLLLLSAARSF